MDVGVFLIYSLAPWFFLPLGLDVQTELPVFLDFPKKIFRAKKKLGGANVMDVANFELYSLGPMFQRKCTE